MYRLVIPEMLLLGGCISSGDLTSGGSKTKRSRGGRGVLTSKFSEKILGAVRREPMWGMEKVGFEGGKLGGRDGFENLSFLFNHVNIGGANGGGGDGDLGGSNRRRRGLMGDAVDLGIFSIKAALESNIIITKSFHLLEESIQTGSQTRDLLKKCSGLSMSHVTYDKKKRQVGLEMVRCDVRAVCGIVTALCGVGMTVDGEGGKCERMDGDEGERVELLGCDKGVEERFLGCRKAAASDRVNTSRCCFLSRVAGDVERRLEEEDFPNPKRNKEYIVPDPSNLRKTKKLSSALPRRKGTRKTRKKNQQHVQKEKDTWKSE
ncbi:hypothetical protein BC829DRAFT_424091 [Chytridium lagenaria]|nr:hypothetical protein BC829DRAFT_424091 [Chytridium lagenaria]